MLSVSPWPSSLLTPGAFTAPMATPAQILAPAGSVLHAALLPGNAAGQAQDRRPAATPMPSGNPSIIPPPGTPPTVGAAGLQAASLRPVLREYGDSSPFMAQWLNQQGGGDTALRRVEPLTGEKTRYLPSNAGEPAEPSPMLSLVRMGAARITAPETAVSTLAKAASPARPPALTGLPTAVPGLLTAVPPPPSASVVESPRMAASSMAASTQDILSARPQEAENARLRRSVQSAAAYLNTAARLARTPIRPAETDAPLEAVQQTA